MCQQYMMGVCSTQLISMHRYIFRVISFVAIPGECVASWDMIPNIGTLGGDFRMVSNTSECQDLCVATPDCVAVDVTTHTSVVCFLHTQNTMDTNNNYSSHLVAQYLLHRCGGGKASIDITSGCFEEKVLTLFQSVKCAISLCIHCNIVSEKKI